MVTQEDTYLMTLSKPAFDKINSICYEQIMGQQIQFLRTFIFFNDIHNSMLVSSVIRHGEFLHYTNKKIIYEEKDEPKYVYFLREGEVILSKVVNIYNEELMERQKILSNFQVWNNRQATNIAQSQIKRINFAYLGPNTYFGMDEVYYKTPERVHRAICASHRCEIFRITKEVRSLLLPPPSLLCGRSGKHRRCRVLRFTAAQSVLQLHYPCDGLESPAVHTRAPSCLRGRIILKPKDTGARGGRA